MVKWIDVSFILTLVCVFSVREPVTVQTNGTEAAATSAAGVQGAATSTTAAQGSAATSGTKRQKSTRKNSCKQQ